MRHGSISDCPLLDSESQANHGHSQEQIVTHQQPELSDSILVDTPDIDSVEISNRMNAGEFLHYKRHTNFYYLSGEVQAT